MCGKELWKTCDTATGCGMMSQMHVALPKAATCLTVFALGALYIAPLATLVATGSATLTVPVGVLWAYCALTVA